jgi:hypothetical protein
MAETLIQPSLASDPNLVALASLPERISALDVAPIVTHDVDRVPASALPHLADQFHVRHTVAWRRAGTDAERRGLVKGALARHWIKGTLAGLSLGAKDAGAELVRAITPPAKLFASPALTVAERNAFMARYPELRLYRHRVVGQRQGAMLHKTFAGGGSYPLISDAWLRILPRAYLARDGREVELTAVERSSVTRTGQAETVTEVRAPGSAAGLAFCGGHALHLAKSDAARRIYRLRLVETYQESSESIRRSAAQPGLTPLDVRFDQVALPGEARGRFIGQTLGGPLVASSARDRLYQSLYLFDPEIVVQGRTAALHLNQGRLSMPAFHAELAVRITGRVQPRAAWRFTHGHLVAQPQQQLDDCLESMRDMARAADRIAIDTAIQHPATAGEQNPAGALMAGDWTSN